MGHDRLKEKYSEYSLGRLLYTGVKV